MWRSSLVNWRAHLSKSGIGRVCHNYSATANRLSGAVKGLQSAHQQTSLQRSVQGSLTLGMAHETVDLTILDSDEDAESPTAAAAREAAQRQKIMEFARVKRSRTGSGPGEDQPTSSAAGQQSSGAGMAASAAHASGEAGTSTAGNASFGNSDLKALHEARMARLRAQGAAAGPSGSITSSREGSSSQPKRARADAAADAAGPSSTTAVPSWFTGEQQGSTGSSRPLTLLTYNVWFREDVALRQRMQGIADVITSSGYPTFLCFQEVTPHIMSIFASMSWWQRYVCCPAPSDAPYFTLLLVNKAAAPATTSSSFEEVHFDNSCMGRSLRVATVTVGGHQVLVATSHLESPIPPHQWYSRERQQQMRFSLAQLSEAPYGNVLFAGDMNWTDSRDGAPPLPAGWCDAWQQLHPGDPGFTYDSKNNAMLPYKNPGLRLDRVFTRLSNYRLSSISIVGRDQLAGATYTHTFKSGGSKQLPVLPSDHFGLLLQLEAL